MTARRGPAAPGRPRERRPRRPGPIALFLALGLAVVASVGMPVAAPAVALPAAAATPELQVTADARYDVQPDRARVHVTLDGTVSNTHVDAAGVTTYYDTAYLAVLPGTDGFRITSPGATPTVAIRDQTSAYTLLTLGLGRRLYAGRSAPFRLQFDLRDVGGTAVRDVRVGASLVAFPVWAFATAETPGGSVTVVFPPGYNVQQQVGSLPDPSDGPGGTLVYTSGTLADPLSFYAYFVADRPGAFTDTALRASVNGSVVPITVRAWADDPAWGTRTGSLVRRSLPALGTAIGLPLAATNLVVQESASRTIGGYAGLFDPVASTIQVAYYAGPFVVLHEAAHAWFNGHLASDRWILEAFASYYAEQAAGALGIDASPPPLTDDLRRSAIPLNAWPDVGRADASTEDYAYAATITLARAIADRAGADGLKAVWTAAANNEAAYQPFRADAPREAAPGPPDWRGLLDLLEERTTADYADLWRTWVVRPTEAHLLDDRAAARAAYASLVVAAGDWELPPSIRRAMGAWQFDQATDLMTAARAVLGQRATIAGEAAAAGLVPPPTLRAAFEGADGPAAAATEADRELQAIAAIGAAATAGRGVTGPAAQLGMAGQDPAAEVAAARDAFAAGNLSAAQAHAAAAQAIWAGAEDRGRGRALSIAVVAIGLAVLAVALVLLVRARRRRRAAEW